MKCTTVSQTIIDLLEQNGDEQIITESLANYYEENSESFDGLVIPAHLQSRFEKYRVWADLYPPFVNPKKSAAVSNASTQLVNAGVPIVFKGAMVLNLAIRDNNPSKVERATRDIDGV